MLKRTLEEVDAFWPEYVAHHAHPLNRALHYAGDAVVAASLVLALRRGRVGPAIAGLAVGYATVAFGHLVVEGNSPLLGRHPVLASICNVRMLCRAVVALVP